MSEALIKANPESDIFHLWCCDKDESMCGLDISELPETDGEGEPKCEKCYQMDLADADCRKCPQSEADTPNRLGEEAVPICPECRDDKHTNCIGQALHPVTDDIVDCLCDHCHTIR